MRRNIFLAAAAALVLLVVAAGCGGTGGGTIPGESTRPATTPQSAPSSSPAAKATVVVYFLKGEAPVPVTREVGNGGAAEALWALLEGPAPGEAESGIQTMIPAGTKLLAYSVAGDRGRADFSAEMRGYGGGSAAVQAMLGQVTQTVLANDPLLKGVDISVEGVPAEEALSP